MRLRGSAARRRSSSPSSSNGASEPPLSPLPPASLTPSRSSPNRRRAAAGAGAAAGAAAAGKGEGKGKGKRKEEEEERPLDVVFLHLDLGIGGAEQLVVNAAVALQRRGHRVRILTSHHDPGHCFAETRGAGPLAPFVAVRGDWLPRQLLGKCTALCAVLRMLYLALTLALEPHPATPDVVFCDGVSAMVPLLRLRGLPVLFYCHFPDKLLCTDRAALLKRLYRGPLDLLEEVTTGAATVVAVNSRFTAQVFREAFARIAPKHPDPAVIYPAINLDSFVPPKFDDDDDEAQGAATAGKRGKGKQQQQAAGAAFGPIVSLNRFERKKNIALALEAFAQVRQRLLARGASTSDRAAAQAMRLVIAGGYDPAVRENVEYLAELQAQARALGLLEAEAEAEEGALVSFRPSISDAERARLLQEALCVLYTPDREHFGIVPLEAMYAGSPVVAVASGGPLETVLDGETGFLRPGTADGFADAIATMVRDPGLKGTMGRAGHAHVRARFGLDAFSATLEGAVRQTVTVAGKGRAAAAAAVGKGWAWVVLLLVLVLFALVVVGLGVVGLALLGLAK